MDYQEEIAAAQVNKMDLEQLGERLAKASHESKASEIDCKLGKVNDRLEHLLDLPGAREKTLKETLVTVQQLDKNMSSLKSWLGYIESELSKPIVYETSDAAEIDRKLNEQQELQRDIVKHSSGIASVLNLCQVLLHDSDACSTDSECDTIQQTTRSLDRRWRNICAMSIARRMKIEETWRLWERFFEDFYRFEDWLEFSERTAAFPSSSGVLYTEAKEELKKYEAFQRQVRESLPQLELINKQYRRLARENRTDSACKLKQMVHEGNQRWDNLQKRVSSILRRLKHFISQREEFKTARDSILVWLTEMDLQLPNIEYFSECDEQAKIKQLTAFQQKISLNNNKIDQIIVQGEHLIEKCEPLDAAVIEEELDELRRYCQEVFGRVERCHKKLIRLPQIKRELQESQLKVASLQDMSYQLLVNAVSTDCLEAKEKLHVMGSRLPVLQKEVTHIKEIEKALDISSNHLRQSTWSSADELHTTGSLSPTSGRSTPSRQRTQPGDKCSLSQTGPSVNNPPSSRSREVGSGSCHSDTQKTQRHQSFFLRVLRAALPIVLLLLLLIALACLVPMTEEDYSCTLCNNFARSFHPMLRYTSGPPPI